MPLNKILIVGGNQVNDHFRLIPGMVETTWKGGSLSVYNYYFYEFLIHRFRFKITNK